MIKIKKYQIEDYISDATQDALDLKADLVDGKVPASQLPSFVDDVIEVANYAALPIPGASGVIYITLDTNKVYRWTGSVYVEIASGVTNLSYTPGVSNGTVNSDTGTDATIPLAGTVNAGLFSAAEKSKLDGIAPNANVGVIPNTPITGATKTKITYDSKGLVTAGADATTADIADSTNKRYVTDANLTVINNTSGTNTGDQGLQSVTDIGASTDNTITINTINANGLNINTSGVDPTKSAMILTSTISDGTTFSSYSYNGSVANYFYSDAGDCIALQADYPFGLGLNITSLGGGISAYSIAYPVVELYQTLTNKGLVINSGTSSTGNFIELAKNSVNKLVVNQAGELTAQKLIKDGGTSSQILAADGSVITAGTNITISGGTISSTGSSGGGGIPHATASGTDTYTATVSGVTSYSDGDAYLIRFPIGNTTVCTLNINSLGAIPLYRNNDGPLIGGDVQANGEMLCVYNSTANTFQCIGTSPNSIISYVTNAGTVTITKGQVVYAFGGTGDRMTVKLASNVGDSTSAQTVGIVLSASIAANQKGFIIFQGLLDNLSILPTATWADGDPVYLGATAGSITKVKPYAPNHLVYIGIVTTASNGGAGRMYVRVQNGYELDELHNVQAQTPTLKDTLWYDNTVSPAQWKTASISTILGYTPANDASVVHLTGNETISGLKTFSSQTILGDGIIGSTQYGLTPQVTVGSTTGGVLDIRNTNTNIVAGNTVGTLQFSAKDDESVAYSTAQIKAITQNGIGTGGSGKTDLIFYTSNGSFPIERVKMNDLGLVINSEVISTIASFDANKSIKSLTTADGYPTLTELKSLVGVSTTAIQTQLNAKQATLVSGTNIRTVNGSTLLGSTNLSVGTVTSVTGTAPVVSSGGVTPAISMAAATGSVDGYLTAANWTTFNNKQDRLLSAYTIMANNTASTADATAQVYKDVAQQTYTATPTWSTSAPTTILANTYEWSQIGSTVNVRISLSYNTGAVNSSVILPMPADMPAPASITGFTGALDVLSYGSGMMLNSTTSTAATGARNCLLRRNAANTGYEFFVNVSVTVTTKVVIVNLTYFA